MKISILAIIISVGVLFYIGFNSGQLGGFNSDDNYSEKSSVTATTTSVGVASTAILSANYNADYRQICLRPADYASSTLYLGIGTATTTNIVGGGIVLSSSTQMCVIFDRQNPYIGAIRGIGSATSSVIVGEY